MTALERGLLLLTSALGDPRRKPLTVPQLRTLTVAAGAVEDWEKDRELTEEDLTGMGLDPKLARHVVELLEDTDGLERYLRQGERMDCFPLTRVSPEYPLGVRKRLGLDAPGCLWTKGDRSLLQTPMVALVGSRELGEPNLAFAERLGTEAARQGITLVSGNARGADRTAQEACLAAGGRVVCVVADELKRSPLCRSVLYLSEDGFDLRFFAKRALSRNRVIHALGAATFVAQCTLGSGGTWDGTVKNLKNGWSPVLVYDDGSEVVGELTRLGAEAVTPERLSDIPALCGQKRHPL